MNYLTNREAFIPPNTSKRFYPAAQAMVISFFVIFTFLSLGGQIPEFAIASYSFNVPGRTELPSRIIIPTLGIDSVIMNPTRSDIATLDRALLEGVVRYPGSGMLGSPGNIVLFGHSSHLKFVHNKAYQSFNDINTLKVGDEIIVYGNVAPFVYRVTSVSEVKDYEGVVTVKSSEEKLTLVTCNNFGVKEDRYVVEATIIK